MASRIPEDLLSCQICVKIYDESERLPRVLACGHSFCHSCLENLFVRKICCPNCSKDVLIDKPGLIPINIALKNLISSISENSELINKSKTRKLQSIGYCDDHDNFKELRCVDCEVWICGICASLQHKQCKTFIIDEAYKEMNKNFLLKVKEELAIRKKIDDRVVETLKTLSAKRDVVINEIQIKNDEFEALEENFSKLDLIKSDGDAINEKLLHLKHIVEHLEQDVDSSSAITELDNLKEQRDKQLNSLSHFQIHFPLSIQILGKMCETESIYAVDAEYRDEDIYGEVRFIDGRIMISSFRCEKPKDGRLIPFNELMRTINKSTKLPSTVFLQLQTMIQKPESGSSIFGIPPTIGLTSHSSSEDSTEEGLFVIIKTENPASPRGKTLILVCSQLLKKPRIPQQHAYIGRTLIAKRHFVKIEGPPPILSGTLDEDRKYQINEGAVFGMNRTSAILHIKLEELLNEYQHNIGTVISGLHELKTCFKLGKTLVVKETGLVI